MKAIIITVNGKDKVIIPSYIKKSWGWVSGKIGIKDVLIKTVKEYQNVIKRGVAK